MMSDFLGGLLVIMQVETVTAFPWYLSTPPPGTSRLIDHWKATDQWKAGVDETAT